MTANVAYRRRQLPVDHRFSVPYQVWLGSVREELTSPDLRLDGVLNVLLVVNILLAVSSVAYAVTVPTQGKAFTEQYPLTEQENGTLFADDYPTEFTAGESHPIIVGIGNNEHRDITYSMVVELQKVRVQNNTTTVLDETELQRLSAQVNAGETWHHQLNITPQTPGTRLRLALLLYTDTPPSNPSLGNAYRETHLWVNVSEPQ